MAFTFTEFPDTAYYHSDLRRILDRLREIDDTLSKYDETIEQLKTELSKIQDLYPRVSNLEQRLTVAETAITSIKLDISTFTQKIYEVEAQEKADVIALRKLIDSLTAEITSIEVKIDGVYGYIDGALADIKLYVARLYGRMVTQFEGLKQLLLAEIEALKKRIDELDTSVKNPWHLEEGRIEQDRNERLVYMDLSDNVPTAIEYCKLGLTADEYSAFELSAIKYCRFGKKILHYDWVYNPITGIRQDINNVLTAIIDNHFGTISADAYTLLELTADDYTAKDITALEYYSFS